MKKLIIVKKILTFMTCSAIATGIITVYPTSEDNRNDVSAKTIAEIQEERKANEAKIAEYESQINTLEGNKNDEKAYQETLSEQIYLIQQNIYLLNNELDKLNDDITKTQSNINHLDSDIGIQQELIDSNIELFKQRLCTMYVSGNENLASIVLGSASFYDIMSRVEMVNRIASYDEELINKLLDEIDSLEKSKKDLETEKMSLEAKLSEQETKVSEKADEITQLNEKMVQTQEVIDRIQLEQQCLNRSKEETQQYLDSLDAEEAMIQETIRKNAEEAQRRYEEEQKRIAAEQEAARLEAERQEAERKAAAEEASRQAASIEAASIEEASKQEASREAERQEASREAERQEASREAERQEASREAERQEASREAERQEASREAERQEASREAERQEASREAERQEASREAERQEASRQAAMTTTTTTAVTTTLTTTVAVPVTTTATTTVFNTNEPDDVQTTSTSTTVSTTTDTTVTQTSATTTTSETTTTTTTATVAKPSASGFIWPTPGFYYISSPFAQRWGTMHKGIDIGDAGIMGGSICASKAGTVTYVSNSCTHNYAKTSSCGCGGGYGNYVIIQHDGTYSTLYGHMTSVSVSVGDYVQQGDVIGTVGSTGFSTGAHLHFEVRVNGVQQDPLKFVSQ
ncbi:MAG: peptidoglycan DD-metalloendopeptidase family protein [Ruminococcus sp.]|nr:peptidoglycan DD-metalloendopeptidase family protein [Ruminococcus sp.]